MQQPDFSFGHMMRWISLLGATLIISLVFLGVIRPFLMPLVLSAIVSAMSAPLFAWILHLCRGRSNLASAITLSILAVLVFAPLLGITYLAGVQAIALSDNVVVFWENLQAQQDSLKLPDWVPFREQMDTMGPEIGAKIADLAGSLAGFAVSSISAFTRGTASFFISLFVFLYATFFFVQMKKSVMTRILAYSGLPHQTQSLLVERVISVSRATIKGTLLIGVVQGALGGLGFWVAGLDSAAFWAVVMGVFSVIPGLGPTAVIFFAVVYLFSQGENVAAIGLAVWGAAIVGTVDNILRPILVGRDAKMHDIMILTSTLGGLAMFGAAGLVLGPVVAGLFVAIWTTLAKAAENEIDDNDDLVQADSDPAQFD